MMDVIRSIGGVPNIMVFSRQYLLFVQISSSWCFVRSFGLCIGFILLLACSYTKEERIVMKFVTVL